MDSLKEWWAQREPMEYIIVDLSVKYGDPLPPPRMLLIKDRDTMEWKVHEFPEEEVEGEE